MAKDINFNQVMHHVKSAAMANMKESLDEDFKTRDKFQDADPPMIIHLALIR